MLQIKFSPKTVGSFGRIACFFAPCRTDDLNCRASAPLAVVHLLPGLRSFSEAGFIIHASILSQLTKTCAQALEGLEAMEAFQSETRKHWVFGM
jgi:hypothetical protein